MSDVAHSAPDGIRFGDLESDFPEQRINTDAGVIGFRECGQGPLTVLLLHGISSGSASWTRCAGLLGQNARVIAWDAPGYGASSPLLLPVPQASDYAGRLDALLSVLGVERCLVVGHSLGALMAAAYGSLAGQRAAHVVLISPALGYQYEGKKHLAVSVRAKRLQTLEEKGIDAMARTLPDRLLTADATLEQRASITRNALRLNAGGYRQAVEMLCSEDIARYALDASRGQVLCGDHDIVTTPEQSADFAHRAGLPFALVQGAGHACYIEQPERVATALGDALERLGERAG